MTGGRVLVAALVAAAGAAIATMDGAGTAAAAPPARAQVSEQAPPTTTGDPYAGARLLLEAGYELEAREAAVEVAKTRPGTAIPPDLAAPPAEDPYAGAIALLDAGYTDAARTEAKAVAKSHPDVPVPARLRPPGRGWLEDVAGWLGGVLAPAGVVLAAVVAALAVLDMLRARLWGRPRVVIKPFTVGGETEVPSESLTRMLTDEMAATGSGHDIRRVVDAAANTGVDFAAALPAQWSWLAPVLRYLNPTKLLTVSGEATVVTTADPTSQVDVHEVTISLTVTNLKGQVVATRAFPVRREDVDPADLLRSQVPMAGAWLTSELRKQGATRAGRGSGWFGTCEWWSWGQFRQGVWYSDHGYEQLADARYRAAVVSDLRNAAAWFNLASRNAHHGRYDDAIDELEAVRLRIGDGEDSEVLRLRFLNIRAVALLNRASSDAPMANPGRDRMEARMCAAELVRRIARAQLKFEDEPEGRWARRWNALSRAVAAVPASRLRPATFVHLIRPPKERDPDLHELVDDTEATALALMASAAFDGHEFPDVEPQADPGHKREKCFREMAGITPDVGVNTVLVLLAGIRTDARGNQRGHPAAYLDALDERAHYNLGCLYAKAFGHVRGEADRARFVDAALRHLERGITDDRRRARWAPQDPELAALRADPVGRRRLDAIVERALPDAGSAARAVADGWTVSVAR